MILNGNGEMRGVLQGLEILVYVKMNKRCGPYVKYHMTFNRASVNKTGTFDLII